MKARYATTCHACGHLQMIAPSVGMQTANTMHKKCVKCRVGMLLMVQGDSMISQPASSGKETAGYVAAMEDRLL